MIEIRRNVIGIGEKTTEHTKKEHRTRNTLTQTIIRKTVSVLILDCGHEIELSRFHKAPRKNTRCHECEWSTDRELKS